MGDWQQVGENLVRHRGGTIYLRAKVAGKIIRQTLATTDLRIAKLKRDDMLAALRGAAAERKAAEREIRTLGDALDFLAAKLDAPHLKASTRDDYRKCLACLRETLPLSTLGRSWSQAEAAGWWRAVAGRWGTHRGNKLLRLVRLLAKLLIEQGLRTTDPTRDLRRLKPVKTIKKLPSRAELEAVIENARAQCHRQSSEAANYIAFLAFSGCRPGEARHATWEDDRGDWFEVHGGALGTKNRQGRMVPVSPALRGLLDGMRSPDSAGLLFTIAKPRFALANSCRRLGVPHLTLYDLRHWFITWAIECGVDIPTIALWVGHQDGGALLMKTYAHVGDRHSLQQARRLK